MHGCVRSLVFAALTSGSSFASTIPPFDLNLSALGNYSATGATLASSLSYPYGMAMTSNGSILFGESQPTTSGGIEGGPSTGSVWMLAAQPSGGFSAPQQLIGGLGGPVTDVRVAQDGTILVDSGAASGRTLTLYNSSGALLASLDFSYPTQAWWHSTGMSLIKQLPDGTDQIFFIVGSEFDQANTTDKVTASGLVNATLNAGAIYAMTVQPGANSVAVISAPVQIVTGVRNPYGLTLDADGNLVVGDNGQDGAQDPNEIGADTLNIVPSRGIGSAILDFGFPLSYTDFNSGARINGDPNATGPLAAFIPENDSNGILQYSEGLAGMAFAPFGSFPFVGPEGGEFIGFHGTKDAAGAANPDDAFLYYDFASGTYFPIIDGGTDGVGHLDTVLVSGNSLFIADFATAGVVDAPGDSSSGAIYQFTVQSVPEPSTGILVLFGVGSLLRFLKR
jgi:hypothetical protein